jgi:hypothetical protein
MSPKIEALRRLVRKRIELAPSSAHELSRFEGGIYDVGFVSPISKTAGNVDSPYVIVLQDWAGDAHLKKVGADVAWREAVIREGRDSRLPIHPGLDEFCQTVLGCSVRDIYVTNAYPYVKRGGMSAGLYRPDLQRAVEQILLAELDIVRPRCVIVAGKTATDAIRRAVGLPERKWADCIGDSFVARGMSFWPQAHFGGRGVAQRGGRDIVRRDWRRLASALGTAA